MSPIGSGAKKSLSGVVRKVVREYVVKGYLEFIAGGLLIKFRAMIVIFTQKV